MSIDQFTPRVLTEAVNKIVVPRRLILDTVFTRSVQSYEETIEYELKTSSKHLMRLVQRGQPAQVVGGEGYTKKTLRLPSMREKTSISAAAILATTRGGAVYGGQNPTARFEAEVASRQLEFKYRAARRMEWMAAMALQGGFTVTQDNVSVEVDFGFSAAHQPTLAAGAKWGTGASTVDINGNLEDWVTLILRDSGYSANLGFMGAAAAKAFKSDKAVKTDLDSRNFNIGTIIDKPGTAYLGSYKGIEWYRHAEQYVDDNGVTRDMVPAKAVIILSTEAPFRKYFGAIADEKAGLQPVEYFSKQWAEEDPSGRWLLVETNPLCVPCDPDAVVFATVL